MTTYGPPKPTPSFSRRRRADDLREIVAKLAVAIQAGDVTPQILELEAIAALCDQDHLYAEAARVRRWIPA